MAHNVRNQLVWVEGGAERERKSKSYNNVEGRRVVRKLTVFVGAGAPIGV